MADKSPERQTTGPPAVKLPPGLLPEAELIVLMKPEAALRVRGEAVVSEAGADISDLTSLIKAEGLSLTPLFGENEDRLQLEAERMMAEAETASDVPDLSRYYRVEAPDERLHKLCEQLSKCASVDAAYITPPTELCQEAAEALEEEVEPINRMLPAEADVPPTSPKFVARQGYLDPAPAGIDTKYAWGMPGGRGSGVNIIDIEGAWRFTHEDLRQNQGGTVGGTQSTDVAWENHGTAVVGVFGGDQNAFGVTGICPDATIRAVSIFGGMGSAAAIRHAANLSSPGDLLLIELHRPGPRFNFQSRADQTGYIPLEFWPHDFDAIRYAVLRGVIVVEAAGNGGENLDDGLYNNQPTGFPATWVNPFNRGSRDSGAILVGAGAPPPNTHGHNHGPDRSRLAFSNFGSAVDVQGWGREVTSTGYGDLQGGPNRDLWYTDRFSGTSSAAPIVTGALGSVQGVLKARGRTPLGPERARELLRTTGSSQTDAPERPRTQRIGNRPNLRQLIRKALYVREWAGVQFTGTVPASQTRTWFTHSWPAYWHVAWSVIPTSPITAEPQLKYEIGVQRSAEHHVTYFISVINLTSTEVSFEARYAVLGR